MNKTLLSLLGLAAISGACTSTRKQPFELENNLSNIQAGIMTEKDAPVDYQTINLAGSNYAVEKATRRFPNEEEFVLREDMESTLWRNFDKHQSVLVSENIWVPRKLPVDEVEFDVEGPYALRAQITRPKTESLAITDITEQLERYGVQTRTMNGTPYAVAIELEKNDKNELIYVGGRAKIKNIILIRTGESDVRLGTRRKDGAITLSSPGDVYELVKTPQAVYDARTNYVTSTPVEALTPSIKEMRPSK